MAKLINFSDLVNKDGVTKRVGELLFATAYETNDLGLVCEIITNPIVSFRRMVSPWA